MTAAALSARTGRVTEWPVAATAAALAPLLGFAAAPLLGEYGLQIGFRLFVFMVLAEAWNLLAGYAGWCRSVRPPLWARAPTCSSA